MQRSTGQPVSLYWQAKADSFHVQQRVKDELLYWSDVQYALDAGHGMYCCACSYLKT
jgi:hypothetical protein